MTLISPVTLSCDFAGQRGTQISNICPFGKQEIGIENIPKNSGCKEFNLGFHTQICKRSVGFEIYLFLQKKIQKINKIK